MKKDLYLYNTAAAAKELFVPANDPVAIYCCGPTVYNYAHIGNLRTYIFEDVLKRTLKWLGCGVRHVVNITDVGHLTSDADEGEDKMESGAAREGKSVWDVAAFYTERFMADVAHLNILPPDLWPKATEHIPQMIALVKALEEKGFTYRTGDGIYFDTSKFPSYCDFARIDPSSLRAGERVEMGEKRCPTDFALWKFSPAAGGKRQMEWQSPWGVGFPGWHIECSAMSLAHLPQPLDIHCGGMDHIRVHHTNEIAQTEAATGKKCARYWMHGEFLVLDKGKMAKSGGNFVTLDTLKERGVSPLGYRMFCYTAHYRSPLTFSFEGALAAEHALANLKKSILLIEGRQADESRDRKGGGVSDVDNERVDKALGPFAEAVCDDLNMPRAVAALWEGLRGDVLTGAEKLAFARAADKVLGLDLLKASESGVTEVTAVCGGYRVTLAADGELSPSLKEAIIEKAALRKKAKAGKDFVTADEIRAEFAKAGVAVKDMPDGSTQCAVSDPALAERVLAGG